MIVELFTSNGSFVHRGEILPFNTEPEVILWGDRVFVRDTRSHGLKYRECFFTILTGRLGGES